MSLAVILVIICAILFLLLKHYIALYNNLKSKKQSQSVKYGKMSEQFFPFLEHFPYDSNNFKFVGAPIDGIQFEDNKIIFIDFKINKSRLTTKQLRIKELIEEGKVYFEEYRL